MDYEKEINSLQDRISQLESRIVNLEQRRRMCESFDFLRRIVDLEYHTGLIVTTSFKINRKRAVVATETSDETATESKIEDKS